MLYVGCAVIPFPFIAWAGHTDQSQAMANSLREALKQHGIKHEDAAVRMRLGREQSGREDLDKQLAGQKPLNLWRLGYLPEVYLTFLCLEARRHNGELLTAEDRAFVIGFATAGLRKMAKCFPHFAERDRKVG